ITPPEEMLWMKAFVQDRDRYDGADVAHLLLCCAGQFDWSRLLQRFHGHEPVLLAHLVFFNYIYPGHRHLVPREVMDDLYDAGHRDPDPVDRDVCNGTNLSRNQYLHDVQKAGFVDPRLPPRGPLSPAEIAHFN